MESIDFLQKLLKKLKVGNTGSIHLNSIPGRYATRLDLSDLEEIEENYSNNFIQDLLNKPKFDFTINYELTNQESKEKNIKLNQIGKKLNSICYDTEDLFLEHGTENFAFGYPLLIKRDSQDINKVIVAPLLIWYLKIKKSNQKKNTWTISKTEEYPILLNEVLLSHIQSDENVTINQISNEMLEDGIIDQNELSILINNLLTQLNTDKIETKQIEIIEKIKDRDYYHKNTTNKPWIQWSGVFGIFKTQKESIIKDIENLIESYNNFSNAEELINDTRESNLACLDTDPSQQEIINSLPNNFLKIIQGPPGTGKSQTITALIANALENKMKCLIVCEKKTALDVIYENLKNNNLDKLCAIIDDVNTDRKKIIDNVREYLENPFSGPYFDSQEYNTKLTEYKKTITEFNSKHHALFKEVFGQKNFKQTIGNYLKAKKKCTDNFLEPLINQDSFQYNYKEYETLTSEIKDMYELYKNNQEWCFSIIKNEYFTEEYRHSIFLETKDYFNKLEIQIKSIIDQINTLQNQYPEQFDQKDNQLKNTYLHISSYFIKKSKQILSSREEIDKQIKSICEIICNKINLIPNNSIKYLDTVKYFQEILNKIIYINQNIDQFENYHHWQYKYQSISDKSRQIVDQLKKENKKNWEDYFNFWYFNNILKIAEKNNGPFLSDEKYNQKINELQTNLQNLQSNKIINYWIKNRYNSIQRFNSSGNYNIKILYNYRKNSKFQKRNSLRNIIYEDFQLFSDIFPVLLINPIVASSILPLKEGLYDLVIFDEASQLRLEDTYTSFLRGKYKIISGDKHQMPPSTYFRQDITIDDENDNDDTTEDENDFRLTDQTETLLNCESLLEYANLSKNFSISYLDYHYRSKHSDLIEFSNKAFYNSRLKTLPPTTDYKAIQFIPVNGLYENQTNNDEARKIIDIIRNDIQPHNNELPSIGIATPNLKQRNLILDLLKEESINDPDFGKKYDELKEKGLFVKNLENIQGDEKDIIIISTTFGINKNDKFSQNFGPLNNKQTGYKLLNVIITRAKQKLIVCTSIPKNYYTNYQEEITQFGNIGKGIFYAYLAYAEAIENNDPDTKQSILDLLSENSLEQTSEVEINKFVESPFEQEVYDYLINYIDKNYIKLQFQHGGYRIDFMILDKNNKPLLAIECDGATYHQSEEAYMCDLYRQKQIEKSGIKVIRIWSTNWWINPEKEIKRIVEKFQQLNK